MPGMGLGAPESRSWLLRWEAKTMTVQLHRVVNREVLGSDWRNDQSMTRPLCLLFSTECHLEGWEQEGTSHYSRTASSATIQSYNRNSCASPFSVDDESLSAPFRNLQGPFLPYGPTNVALKVLILAPAFLFCYCSVHIEPGRLTPLHG